jgi:hypothetical protein
MSEESVAVGAVVIRPGTAEVVSAKFLGGGAPQGDGLSLLHFETEWGRIALQLREPDMRIIAELMRQTGR